MLCSIRERKCSRGERSFFVPLPQSRPRHAENLQPEVALGKRVIAGPLEAKIGSHPHGNGASVVHSLFEPWEKAFQRLLPSHQQPMYVFALGSTRPWRGIRRQRVILHDKNLFEVIGERTSRAKPAHSCTNDNRLSADVIAHTSPQKTLVFL